MAHEDLSYFQRKSERDVIGGVYIPLRVSASGV